MNKIKLLIGSIAGAISSACLTLSVYAAGGMSSSTLGASIDDVNETFMAFLGVLIDKYWPFLLGAIILVLVWAFGKRILMRFT